MSMEARAHVLSEVRLMMSRVFGVGVDMISETSSARDIERWDSLSLLTVVIGMERRLNTLIPVGAAQQTTDVASLVDVICMELQHA